MKRILFYSPYWYLHTLYEITIAHSLMLRGAEVKFVCCDGLYSDCDMFWENTKPRNEHSCEQCINRNKKTFEATKMPFEWLGKYLPCEAKEEARRWADSFQDSELFNAVYHNYPLGKWVNSSVHSHFRMKDLDILDAKISRTYRSYLYSSVIALNGLSNLLENYKPDILFLLNGRFFCLRIALELAKERSIRVITHERGRTDNSLYIVEGATAHSFKAFNDNYDEWKSIPLDKDQMQEIEKLLHDREKGRNTGWKSFVKNSGDISDIIKQLQLSDKRKVITLFTSSLDETSVEEGWEYIIDQFEWIQRTIDYFGQRKDHQLIIRVHPNVLGVTGSDVQSMERINKIISAGLPDNVKVIKWDEQIDSYRLIELSKACIVYRSRIGLEASAKGKPVLYCTRGSFYGHSFALNLPDANKYESFLDKLLMEGFSLERLRMAYRFGYHYFIRYNIPFPLVSVIKTHNARINYTTTAQLLPGEDKSLDRICDFILLNKPIYPSPKPGDKNFSSSEEDKFLEEKKVKIEKLNKELEERIKDTSHKPTVSVVIPCYKYGCYLPEAVSSVLNQTYQNFEIIIVNDGSPDDTKEVAEKLIAEHPQHQIRLINQANSGQPAIARNNGIAEAKGEYILPLDADDKLAPQAIESYIRAVEDYPEQPIVVFGWLQYFGVEEDLWKTHPFSPDRLLRRTLLPYCSMFHRSVWEFQNGYSANVPGYEDWDFWVGAAKMGAKFINVPLVTAFYRETDASSLVDSARKRHEWLVAGIISNHSDIYEDEEIIWATDYLERFPEAPEERQIHGQNDKFPKASAVLVVSYEELYTPEEVAWARQFLRKNPFKIVKGIKPGPVKVDASCESESATDLDYFIKARQEFSKGNFEIAVKYMQKYRLMMDYSRFPRILNKSGRSDDIKVSVIIVTYNRTQDLTRCLESLAKQDCADFETVVVDNGENDFEVFEQYVDQYIKCPINFVLSEGRNIGACCAKGRIIAFLDDDALVPPNYISSIKTAFETYDIFGLRGKVLLKSDPDANKEPRGYNLGNSVFPTFCDMEGNSAFLREVYISLDGMDPLLFGHEGIDFTYRIIEKYGVVNKIIYWPDTIIYHDEATGDCHEEKANRQALMDKYLNFKHKANIVALRNTIEKSACSKRITPVGQIA